jgi:uncharacterized hydrophobic protein (TIGR00271 family)
MAVTATASEVVDVEKKERYRILLPIDREDGHGLALLYFAQTLARSCNGEILILHVITPESLDTSGLWQIPEGEVEEDVPQQLVTIHSDSVVEGILETARNEQCDLILLHGHRRSRSFRNRLGHVLDPVIEDAPCDVALLRGEISAEQLALETKPVDERSGDPPSDDEPTEEASTQPKTSKIRILLDTTGGRHAVGAAELAMSLARFYRAAITLITVIPKEASADEEADAQQQQAKTMEKAGFSEAEIEEFVEARVIRADDVEPAIVSASKNHTMVFLGASQDSVINQLLLGTRVERLSEQIEAPTVVVKRYSGLSQYWLRRLWRFVDRTIPDVSGEERIETYKRVRRGARATHDFFILILLSVMIATMGLLLDSAAVIIGAMLVAPLMTPILGLGLGVVMGDTNLLRVAARSTVQGTLLAVAVSTVMAWMAPLVIITTEISSRTQPNLFDLTVGLAAGAAGAYGISRRNVAAALPGVAIAAALVPPLAVIGISLANGNWGNAAGATLLYGTNLAAISFAGAFIYMMLGFYPEEKAETERHVLLRRGMLAGLVLIFVISIPLAQTLVDETTQGILDRRLNEVLRQTLNEQAELSLFSINWERDAPRSDPLPVRVVIYAATEVTAATRLQIEEAIVEAIGRDVRLRLIVIPIQDLREVDEPPDEGR